MAAERKPAGSKSRRQVATTPEERENQLIDLSVRLAEKQIREGTVSSQVQSLYIKAGLRREQLEQERLRQENELLRKKIEAMASAARTEELMKEALAAFRSYSPEPMKTYDD